MNIFHDAEILGPGVTAETMPQQFPSVTSLRAFEATARHLSFTRAAIELNLTQTAISHQIKKLEDLLGSPLFIRQGNTIRLTEVAHEYLGAARTAIGDILVATDRAIDRRRGDTLTIVCPGTYSIKCLIPNLAHFRRKHPKIMLRIKTLVPTELLIGQSFDVAIQYGSGDWPGMTAYHLGSEEVYPVCSPSLLKRRPGLKNPSDLKHHTIIRTRSPYIMRDDWSLWLEKAGVGEMEFGDEITCDLLYPSFEAAIEGLGVALGRSVAVERDIKMGRLVEPFSIRLMSTNSFCAVVPAGIPRPPQVDAFLEWITNRPV